MRLVGLVGLVRLRVSKNEQGMFSQCREIALLGRFFYAYLCKRHQTTGKNAKRWTVGCLTFPVGRRDPRVRRRNSRKELLVMARIITIKHALPWTAKRNPRLYRYALGVYNELLWALEGLVEEE